uniref:Putative wd40-repeat-containing subunit of the 18s rrna processing complex n=1 Tax=Panstrongylus megistus TaxID=65343 RepID=A0A069DXE8_9HEMI
MGLTKQYLRYEPSSSFNVITSGNCNISAVIYEHQEGRFLAAGACESVYIWDLRLGEKALTITNENHTEVTRIAASPDKIHIAIGHADGTININNLLTEEVKAIFSGHRSAINCLAFDTKGHRIASGGKDTEIVVWDIVAECGLTRLSGHKGVVTALLFLKQKNILISSSKDTFIKFWDLDTSHCFQTIAAHVTEVWDLALLGEDEYLVAGSNDSELLVWSLQKENRTLQNNNDDTENPFVVDISVVKAGSILRERQGRLISLATDAAGSTLAAHGKDNNAEVFAFLSKDEATKRSVKRYKKEKKKALKLGQDTPSYTGLCLKDFVVRLPTIKSSAKIKSLSVVKGKSEIRIGVSLANNKLELHSITFDSLFVQETEPKCLRSISNQGHQGEVRAVAFSSDNLAIASAGSNSVKIWNRKSLQCLRTIETGYALCICFVPGDRHALVGMKDGHLLVVDLSVGDILEKLPAHTSEVWSVIQTHDQTGAITASGDTTVKVWSYELLPVPDTKTKVLSLRHTRTLKLDDPVLYATISPSGKFLAAALLDCTVKIFFMDTFKFFISLYGHKLPILCTDISSDSTLIITGSADRNVKIWGLDFGDCHKSLFAHDDSVTYVKFLHGTHYFFTAGKDGLVKQWDADSFNKIITLKGHFGECWGLSIGGDYVVSCGQDRAIRVFEKTEEPLVLNDEEEEERAKDELATGESAPSKLPSTKTVSSEKGAELLIECLDSLNEYQEGMKLGLNPDLPTMMGVLNLKSPQEYLAKTISNIRASDLEEALILLPFHNVSFLMTLLPQLLAAPLTCEIAAKTLLLLLKVHHGPVTSDTSKIELLEKIETTAMEAVTTFRDMVGVNLHGLMYIQKEIEKKEGILMFKEVSNKFKEKQQKKRRKEKLKKAAAILTL